MSQNAPGEVQPWLLLGERRRRSIEDHVAAAARRWAAHWVAGTPALSVEFEPAVSDRSVTETQWRESHEAPTARGGAAKGIPRSTSGATRETIRFGARRNSGEWLAGLAVPRRLVAWAAGLEAMEFPATNDLDDLCLADADLSASGEIELDLLRAFWSLLVTQAAVEAPLERLDDAQAQEARLALGKRGLAATCDFGPGLGMQWTLSPTTVAMLLSERRVSYVGESLMSRRSAVTQAPVAIDCCLGSIQVPVRDLHSLRIGDVLMTDIALDGRAELRVRSKPRPIATGTIGESMGRKAIKVEAAEVVAASQGLRQ